MERALTSILALGLGITIGRKLRRWISAPGTEEDPLSVVSDSARVIAGGCLHRVSRVRRMRV